MLKTFTFNTLLWQILWLTFDDSGNRVCRILFLQIHYSKNVLFDIVHNIYINK